MTLRQSAGFTRARTAGFCCLAFLSLRAVAQTTTPTDAQAPGSTVELPTFTVSTSQDKGYRATNSVSATRVDTPIKDLPFAITALTEQFITDTGARELTDIVNFAPGVTSGAKEFTQGNNRYSIRGFDGDVTPQRNGFIGNRYVDAGNITRVEVVKGPASLLYGQITPGGTVNYITKRPQDKSFTQIKQQVGTDSFLRTDLDVNLAPENAGGRFKARLVGAYENGFQWTDPGESKSTLIAPSVAFKVTENSTLILDYERFRRRETPLVGMMPNLSVSVAATAANFPNVADRARAQAYVDVGNLNLGFRAAPPLPYDFNYVNDTDYRKSDFDSFNLEYAINLGSNWTARVNYAWNDFYIGNKLTGLAEFTVTPAAAYLATKNRFDYVAEVVANPAILSDPNKTASALLTRRKRIEESAGNSDTFQAEVTGKLALGNVTVKPLFGAYLSKSESFARRRESTTAPGAGVANVNTTPTQHFQPWDYNNPSTWDRSGLYDEFSLPWGNLREGTGEESALYGVLNASFFDDRLIAIGGARYNKTKSTGINYLPTVAAVPGATIPDPDYEATKTTPQFGIGYKVRRDLLLFASYSESFFIEERVLTLFNPAYNPALPTNATTNPLTISAPALPTTGSGYEFGVKTDFFNGRVSSTVSLFHLERENRILRFRETAVDGTFPTITRQGTVDESEGVEMEVTWSPLDNWQIYATATFMDIKTTKATFPAIPVNADPIYQAAYVAAYNEAVGLVLNAVPEGSAETLGSLWSRYSFNDGSLRGLWVAGGFVYTGEKAQRTANPTLFYDAHTVFDAVVGYDWKWHGRDMGASLSWKNVTDEQYFPANQARGLPSRFVLSLSAKF
ncbi:TonB-dependent siderophore receptor [Oleiharenicola lentus]|uniref:TonB-dependent siderophore receptor n=1 Tax=Oleiharenicola lentus TaxID=2508720 RepID=UPI003F67656A